MKINSVRPGCKDIFHAFLVEGATYYGKYDIPCISPETVSIKKVIPFSRALRSKERECWIHFYEDDYLFERVWNNPKKYLTIFERFQGVILPDFSLYRDMPFSMQIWNIYRSRALGYWLQKNNIKVIANVRFGDDRTYAISCDGLSLNSTIAIGTIGCIRDGINRKILVDGIKYVVNILHPSTIVFVGSVPQEVSNICCLNKIPILHFDGGTTAAFKEVS